MASKIVLTKSDPAIGEINLHDLRRITQDFENLLELKSSSARQFYKTPRVAMKKEVLQALLDEAEEGDYISIRFGITLPEQLSCLDFKTDISNQMTVAILLAQKNTVEVGDGTVEVFVEKDQPGNLVITSGFKTNGFGGVSNILCCGDPNGDS